MSKRCFSVWLVGDANADGVLPHSPKNFSGEKMRTEGLRMG